MFILGAVLVLLVVILGPVTGTWSAQEPQTIAIASVGAWLMFAPIRQRIWGHR